MPRSQTPGAAGTPLKGITFLVAAALLSVGLAVTTTSRAEGATLWLLVGLHALILVWAAAAAYPTFVNNGSRSRDASALALNMTLLVVSLCGSLIAAETLLRIWERRSVDPAGPSATAAASSSASADLKRALESFEVTIPQEVLRRAARRQALRTLPPELGLFPVKIQGAAWASRWHGALHVHDRNGMRRKIPFPAKREGVFRIMVLGDSLTYGYGIDERWTYARQLEALLGRDHRVEVLNLGVSGYQSEDVLKEAERHLPRLRPDLVVYGVCLNDFLPSGIGQDAGEDAYGAPLPDSLKTFFARRSRLARLIGDAYDQALLRLGLRVDFFDDILRSLEAYRSRFARDVTRLNELVRSRGLPPVVALALAQVPAVDSRGHRIALAAEEILATAGLDVIDTAAYFQRFDGHRLRVSRWEGHPNEVANSIWAAMLNRHLRDRGYLASFRNPGDQ